MIQCDLCGNSYERGAVVPYQAINICPDCCIHLGIEEAPVSRLSLIRLLRTVVANMTTEVVKEYEKGWFERRFK